MALETDVGSSPTGRRSGLGISFYRVVRREVMIEAVKKYNPGEEDNIDKSRPYLSKRMAIMAMGRTIKEGMKYGWVPYLEDGGTVNRNHLRQSVYDMYINVEKTDGAGNRHLVFAE